MSLFTTTLMFSFLVVATPHFLPCPVDPRTLTDSENPDALSGEPRRRRRRKVPVEDTCNDIISEGRRKLSENEQWAKPKRECPVPKPSGLIGQVLGVKKEEEDEEDVSITTQLERARRKALSKEEDE
ncbi:hypothetical protein K504DRAFT_463305 [Pleomassaria siparia CBS 279.74]|uniref:Alpha-1,3-mannosyltransferase n=1 Tax=Pleomassaria siparia CBS 279.74 TaxID=1314801 RepID=A0A6G1JSJ5_9PLEO|nr:hypothetical protein K504DRAFT_463305 [Pleomassaria siparia CBS 279.74]